MNNSVPGFTAVVPIILPVLNSRRRPNVLTKPKPGETMSCITMPTVRHPKPAPAVASHN